jgi:hypothetical protein
VFYLVRDGQNLVCFVFIKQIVKSHLLKRNYVTQSSDARCEEIRVRFVLRWLRSSAQTYMRQLKRVACGQYKFNFSDFFFKKMEPFLDSVSDFRHE